MVNILIEMLTFAEVSIDVRVKWWRTNTFTRLYAFFVSFTLAVTSTSFLSWRTQTVIWISAITVWTDALMRSWEIYAFGSVATYLMSNDALVYIYNRYYFILFSFSWHSSLNYNLKIIKIARTNNNIQFRVYIHRCFILWIWLF